MNLEKEDNKIFRKEKKIKLKYLEQVSKSHHLNSDGFGLFMIISN